MSYADQTILLASQHRKEEAIAPAFQKYLQANLWVPKDFDTDQFGMFTGEITRKENQYQTLIAKAKRAADLYGFDYVIASEGSFGPHPHLILLPAGVEMLVFMDIPRDLVIVESLVTLDTNFAHQDVSCFEECEDFLRKRGFPSHGLVVRSLETNNIIAKGIQALSELENVIASGLTSSAKLRLETDMRAHMNPTRMKVIALLSEKLALRVASACPACLSPGFGQASKAGNLNCEA